MLILKVRNNDSCTFGKKGDIARWTYIYVYILTRMLLKVPVENFSKIKMKIEDRTYGVFHDYDNDWCN